MKSLATKSAAALLVTLVLGFGASRLLHSSAPAEIDPSTTQANAAKAASDESSDKASSIALRQWSEGDSFLYDLDTTRGMATIMASQSKQELKYHVVGQLRITVMGKGDHGVRLRADVLPRSVNVQPQTDRNAEKLVTGTVYVRANTKGAFEEFSYSREVPVESRILLKAIVSSFQMTVPSAPPSNWQVVEADPSGQYNATYRVSDANTIEKSKTQYIRTRGPAGFMPLQKGTNLMVQSAVKFGIDSSGWPKSLSENESLEVSMQKMRMVATTKSEATLVGIEKHPEWMGAFPGDVESDTVSEKEAFALAKQQADTGIVGGRSFGTITKELQATDSHARNQAQGRMSAMLRVEPSAASKVTQEILHGEGDANSKSRLIGSLGSAGTKEAQDELVRLMEMDKGEYRVEAAAVLGRTKNPTASSAEALKSASASTDKNLASTAILAEGTMIRTMNSEKSGDTTDAVQSLIEKLANASTEDEKYIYIEALGNTGDIRTMAAITPYLKHDLVSLRAAATGALKFMVEPAADEALIQAIADNEMWVRKAAASTIAYRPIAGVLEAFDALLKNEQAQIIRTTILQGMNTKLVEEPSVLESVEWAMENDPSASVRSYAKQIVDAAALDKQQ